MTDPFQLAAATSELLTGANSAGPAQIRLSLGDIPEHNRLPVYREFFGRTVFRLDVEPLRDVPFMADATLRFLPGLQLFSGRVHGSRNWRTRQMLDDGIDDCTLMLNLGGPYVISQRDVELTLADGDATFISTAEPVSFTHYPPGGVLAVQVPRGRFSPYVSELEDCYMRLIPSGTPALGLLRDYVHTLCNEQDLADCDLQQMAVSHVYDLMAAVIGATNDVAHVARERGLRAARLHAIKQDIANNLARPGLSVAALADRHRCTPRSVQRLFETAGTTFTEYVLEQRLMRAHRVLSDPRRDGSKICAVAYGCGFGDVSYFNRMFRRRFGAAPSDIRIGRRSTSQRSSADMQAISVSVTDTTSAQGSLSSIAANSPKSSPVVRSQNRISGPDAA